MTDSTNAQADRIKHGLAEIGVLLITFAPLDVAINQHEGQPFALRILGLFLGIGVLCFTFSLSMEKKQNKTLTRFNKIFMLLSVITIAACLLASGKTTKICSQQETTESKTQGCTPDNPLKTGGSK